MKGSKSGKRSCCLVTDFAQSCKVIFLVILSSILTLQAIAESGATIDPEDSVYGEYEVKAAYLYKFPKFITWPEDSFTSDMAAFNLCVLGEDKFGDALLTGQSTTINGRQVKIAYKIEAIETLGCHLLFIGASESGSVDEILPLFDGLPIVTVSDISGFAKAGGIIELTVKKGRIAFKINRGAAHQQHLTISASLLNLAVMVFREDE
jgi:hypothetical protein